MTMAKRPSNSDLLREHYDGDATILGMRRVKGGAIRVLVDVDGDGNERGTAETELWYRGRQIEHDYLDSFTSSDGSGTKGPKLWVSGPRRQRIMTETLVDHLAKIDYLLDLDLS